MPQKRPNLKSLHLFILIHEPSVCFSTTKLIFIYLRELGCFWAFKSCMARVLVFFSFFKIALSFHIQGRHALSRVHLRLFFMEISVRLKYFFHGSVFSLLLLWPKAHFSFKCSLLFMKWCKQGFYIWTAWRGKNREKNFHSSHLCVLEKTVIPPFKNSNTFIILLCKLWVLEELECQQIAKSVSYSVASKY